MGSSVIRGHHPVRPVAIALAVALALLIAGEAAPALFTVGVSIDVSADSARVSMDGQQRGVPLPASMVGAHLLFEQPGPLQREYQLDGSDTTARKDRNNAQFQPILNTPWYRFMAWLRDEGSYSHWQDVALVDAADGHVVATGRPAVEDSPLPAAFRVEARLRRPEAPARIWLVDANGAKVAGLSVERDSHRVAWLHSENDQQPTTWFFPNDPWPFAADIAQLIGRTAAAAIVLLALMGAIGWVTERWLLRARRRLGSWDLPPAHVVAALVLVVWFTATLWITVRLYHQLPHIVDAQAYYFQSRILETGRTWLRMPDMVQMLDGFQQVEWNGRWFAQYPPGAPALYALGGLVGLAWLVGPLATLVMLGATAVTGLLVFNRWIAMAALGLLAISPFVLFQAGSFMSHPIAGGAVACSLAAFAYAWRTDRRGSYLWLGALLGVAFNTREITALLYGLPFAVWFLAYRRWRGLLWILLAALPFLLVYLLFNLSTTGDPLTLPRNLFDPRDRWGFGDFGPTVHTLAAGLVNTDENLTLLQFDLFGWPPLAALALVGLPFLLGRATRFDVLLAAIFGGFVVAYVGYFYHGIALGPRYYFEAVPALALLAARGIQTAVLTLRGFGLSLRASLFGARVVVAALCAWTLGFYLPHAIDRRMDFGALTNGRRLVLPFVDTTLGGPQLSDVQPPAVVLVPNEDVFKSISALNCPLLEDAHLNDCPVLLINTSREEALPLLTRFPGRSVWMIDTHGDLVTLQRIQNSSTP